MQTRNVNLFIADLVGRTKHSKQLGTLSWTCLSMSEAAGVKEACAGTAAPHE
jgi:hypothetical protein